MSPVLSRVLLTLGVAALCFRIDVTSAAFHLVTIE